ncbi:MAG TPA: Nramp family divalent metal transporter [Pirellulales bacterium]|nr:Nramp family divalent metal transporter [Pirellulales bacterium]
MTGESSKELQLPETCLPAWGVAELSEPPALSWRHWTRFIGPGIVMMGIQIGGGEWLFGPEVTARYGGGLMWIASVAIIFQVFYNIECGRYALYCGEPVFTGFMRTRPGPRFWIGVILLLNLGAFIPGLSTHAAAMLASLMLDRPPGAGDSPLVTGLAYALLFVAVLPVLVGGKIYNTLQWIMTTKVVVVLGFCLVIGLLCVSPANWSKIFSGFLKFGTVPTVSADGHDSTVNLLVHRFQTGAWPLIELGNIAVLGAFAGYAGGGGLANAAYSNFVRDKGWGMGAKVGAIPSAVGGHSIALSHVGKVFPITPENMTRWRGWWRYIMTDQVLIWGPGCVMGMALPALMSLQFASHSSLAGQNLDWAQSLITADGIRHAPQFAAGAAKALWIITVLVGMLVMLPSQMSVVDEVSRRYTDILWSGSQHVRENLSGSQVRRIYYSILSMYVLWSLVCAYLFNTYGTPKLMTIVIANVNNVAIGATAVHLLWINTRLLPKELKPRWYNRVGVAGCAVFYLGMALLVFIHKQWPALRGLFDSAIEAVAL